MTAERADAERLDPKCKRDFVDCAHPGCDCFRSVGGIITDDRVFVKCMAEAWDNPEADPTATIGRFLRLLRERDATIARLKQERDDFRDSLEHAANDRDKAMTERDAATREAEGLRAENQHLRMQAGLSPIKTPAEQAMRETINGQGLSMRAMSDELREKDAIIARLRAEAPAQPSADDVERARAREVVNEFSQWIKADSGVDFWIESDADTVLENMLTAALTAASAQGIAQGREPLPCGHVAANIGDTGSCEACNDVNAKYAQGRAEMREIDDPVIEAARDLLANEKGDWTLADRLSTTLESRDAAIRALPVDDTLRPNSVPSRRT